MTRETSVSLLANSPTRNERVLPLVCITCQRDKHEKNKNGPWVKVNLVTCEGDGQKLLDLAERRHDEKIILHVSSSGTSILGRKMRHHKSCYRSYTGDSSITKKEEHLKETTDVVFEQFCTDVVAENLYQDQKILCMNKLHEMYVECGKEHGIDLSTTKQTLKKKLVLGFAGLHFLKHKQRNKSELVYFHEMFPTKHSQ